MTEERLRFLEAHFRNPHSVAGLSEFGMELVWEVKILRAELAAAMRVNAAQAAVPVVDQSAAAQHRHEAPTPPMGVAIDDRPEPKKKGKR